MHLLNPWRVLEFSRLNVLAFIARRRLIIGNDGVSAGGRARQLLLGWYLIQCGVGRRGEMGISRSTLGKGVSAGAGFALLELQLAMVRIKSAGNCRLGLADSSSRWFFIQGDLISFIF